MLAFFAVCAVAGGTVLVVQLALLVFGLGHHGFDGTSDAAHDVAHGAGHDSSFFFRVVSFRSLTAAVTFFGLAGGLCVSSGVPPVFSFAAATGLGAGVMVLVAWLMQLLMSLHSEGTVQIEETLGQPARVYLSVPGQEEGLGKVMVTIGGREVEYQAMTRGERLPAGASAIVDEITDLNTVFVIKAE